MASEGYGVGVAGGRPAGTTASEGYGVSEGRPAGTTATEGYGVGTSGGRPAGTTANEGYDVGTSGGRPAGTTANEGYDVGTSGGRPAGTTANEGYDVGTSGGRPAGTTANEGYDVGTSGGRPAGTTANEGYDVGTSGGRPAGTTATEGYGVGTSGGRPVGTTVARGFKVGKVKRTLKFDTVDADVHFGEWDTSAVNLDAGALSACARGIKQQRFFDRKSLGVGVCYSCGHVLWTSVDGAHTFLIDKPSNMTRDDAPAAAYLRAVPNCSLSFEYTERGSSTKERWYCCSHCKTDPVPTEFQVGNVYGDSEADVKPVREWDMSTPKPIKALCNKYETGQVSLCGLFSSTVKKASMSQYQHLQGEINAIRKLDRHYYGLFGFMAVKDSDIFTHSPDPHSALRIKNAIRWFRAHNHLYSSFFAHYETLLRYVKPGFINPGLLEDQNISLDRLLEGEAAGMAFPLDAKYFDDFPLIYNEPALGPSDKAGRQYPQPQAATECREKLVDLCHTTYGEKYLDTKAFPHLHPYGHGGWYHRCPMAFQAHIKMRLFDVRGRFAADPCYCFFKYDYMVKVRMRMHNARKVVKVQNLTQTLNAANVRGNDPYAVYGTDIPRVIPGSKQFWKSFGLDLVSFVEQRGLPQYFLTLTAHDLWPQVQATLNGGWGSCASEVEVQGTTVEDRQPVGFHPEISVLAAEKRYNWFMSIPLGVVQDLVVKKEYQKRGAVHWHMLVWVEEGTSPKHAVMAEMPRGPDTTDECATYVRKLVGEMLLHKQCFASRCFKGSHGRTLSSCKYGFPFKVPEPCERLDDEMVRYLYQRTLKEDALVVPYNPEIAVLWRASHNVQRVSKHGFEQYLAKYISKPEPSCSIELPENASEPQRYLRTRVIGSVEAMEVLMGFHQCQMSRQVIFLHTELNPTQRMLKPTFQLKQLDDEDSDIYLQTKVETYLKRPVGLHSLTYPEFYRWWRSATTAEQKKATAEHEGEDYSVKCKGSDDFEEFLCARKTLDGAQARLSDLLQRCDAQVGDGHDLLALNRALKANGVPQPVLNAVEKHYNANGVDSLPRNLQVCPPEACHIVAQTFLESIDWEDSSLMRGLCTHHWLMGCNMSDRLVALLTRYKPGTVLEDCSGHHWYRRAKMVVTRNRFISSVGDDQEKYYQQKYLLTVPLTPQSQVVLDPPESWVELCVREGMCDEHLDAMSCMQSAVSRGFHTDSLRQLAQVYVDHGFLSDNEADLFLSEIPVLGEREESETTVSDQMLDAETCDLGISGTSETPLEDLVGTFTESQLRAYRWIESQLNGGKQVNAAVVGPAGTGKSYLLKGLIELAKSKQLVVGKLAPSGVAAHLIGGTTIHNFFALDIEYNSSLEEGTVQVAKLRKTDVLVIDEFSMLDWFLFRTAEGLCRKFSKRAQPWGGRHVILLGDPAQLPAVGQRDIFGTTLWTRFSVLLLREVKRATDPVLSEMLSKVRLGVCDDKVTKVLESRVEARSIPDLDLQKTVVICSTRKECEEINSACIDIVEGMEVVYEALDTDHHGHPLREADLDRLKRCREKLPDKLILKVGARVVLRRNLDIAAGWVNGTLAVVTHLHDNCIIVRKLTNPSHKHPIPRFRQRIEIRGASYTIMRQQFPLQLAYGVTVHRVQGCTVQRAIVCLSDQFFESGQAYVALSRVRTLEDLVLWDFDPSAIKMAPFYRQLLEWCDCVDKIRPTPPLAVVEYPIRVRDEPMDITPDSGETAAPKPIPFSANIDFSAETEQEVKCKGR